jgi:hypothetical protein
MASSSKTVSRAGARFEHPEREIPCV